MSQALLIFDPSGKLVIANHRHIEMYALSPELVKPGCTVRELLERRQATGTFSDDIDE
jgi:hypothetical protein